MNNVYEKVLEFKNKFPGTVAWRLKKHCEVIEGYINPDEYVGKRKYHNLTQFTPDTYYLYSNRNFYIDKSTSPTSDTLYYKLGEPI